MAPARFGSATLWGGKVRAVPAFGSGGSSGEGGFPVFQHRLTERMVSVSVHGKTVPMVPVQRSVHGKTVPMVPVSSSGPVRGSLFEPFLILASSPVTDVKVLIVRISFWQ